MTWILVIIFLCLILVYLLLLNVKFKKKLHSEVYLEIIQEELDDS